MAERLQHYLKKSGMSARRVSLAAGLSDTAIKDIISGKSKSPTEKSIRAIADALEIPASHLIEGQRTVPIVGRVGAGAEIIFFDDHEKGAGHDEVESAAGLSSQAVAVQVLGDSQYPAYREGDIVIYDEHVPPSEMVGRECIVRLADGRTMLKILMRGANNLFDLHSYNAPPIVGVAIDWVAPISWVKRAR